MLEKPAIADEQIIACLRSKYGLAVRELTFLPLGADLNTAVYRVTAADGRAYFLKLRGGQFNPTSVTLPGYLAEHGLQAVIPPLPTRTGRLWAALPPYKTILYPYIEGRNAYEFRRAEQHWLELGAALNTLHTTRFPLSITHHIPREHFSPRWRARLKTYLRLIQHSSFNDPTAAAMADFLNHHHAQTLDLVRQAENCARALRAAPPAFTVCHGDIHGWNLLIDSHDTLFIVDWDTLIFSPKERDLMFIGGGLADSGYSPREEELLFTRGYGDISINPGALAYYRFERVIEDLAIFCEQVFGSTEDSEDRRQALVYLKSNYLPGSTIERAYQSSSSFQEDSQ